MSMPKFRVLAALLTLGVITRPAIAEEAPAVGVVPSVGHTGQAPTPVHPATSPARNVSLEPTAAESIAAGRVRFEVDPIADSAIIATSFGFGIVLEFIGSTGEIRPQQIAPNFDRNNLIGIDRASLLATPSSRASSLSNLGLGAAAAFAVVDPIVSGVREKSVQTALVDAMLYAESLSLTLALTNMVKLAVRRPRPGAYIDAEAHKNDLNYLNTNTNSALSFFSGHSSATAAIGATATYLAFARSPRSARPWLTLTLAAALTTFVSIERVEAGKHFPTDVIAGSVAGAGIGVIVPHLHRGEDVEQRRVWIGFAPVDSRTGARGGSLNLSGAF